jgi:DNA (cytosine-5)-methyltransferase 1
VKFISVCSGIEAASQAWNPLGWEAVAFSEIEPFPCAVLAHHYPNVPNYGDMTKFQEWPDHAVDLLCGGTPCQSFSVAGLRKGLDDPRGNLMLTFGAIAAKYRPQWLVWENVPGVLSSNGGRDFGSFLGMLGQLGYGFAYRVLDAQYFGVAQRRRRVFVVGCFGDWRSAAAVLFERHSLSGNPAPSRKAREVAPTIPSRSTGGGGLGTDFDCDGGLQVAGTMKACKDSGGWSNSADHAAAGYMVPVGTFCVATGQAGAEIGAEIGADMAPTLNCNHEAPYVAAPMAFVQNSRDEVRFMGGDGQLVGALAAETGAKQQCYIAFDTTQITSAANYSNPKAGDPCHPLAAGAHAPAIAFHPTQDPISSSDGTTHAMGCGSSEGQASIAVAVALRGREGGGTAELGDEVQNCLRASSGGGDKPHVLTAMQVRRLTPRECERLQGFPDDYTLIPWRTYQEAARKGASYEGLLQSRGMTLRGPSLEECPDGPRYKALGNSWAVPNVRWIGERLQQVEAIRQQVREAA